jgi:hypothetical protein
MLNLLKIKSKENRVLNQKARKKCRVFSKKFSRRPNWPRFTALERRRRKRGFKRPIWRGPKDRLTKRAECYQIFCI